MSDKPVTLTPAEIDFIERMGINAEADGQARITGRIWGLLMAIAFWGKAGAACWQQNMQCADLRV